MRRVLATLVIALLAAAAGYKAIYGPNGTIVYQAKKAEYERLRLEIAAETEHRQQLKAHVKALQSDPKAIEKEAREQLGYVRMGERVLVQRPPRAEIRATNVAQNQPAVTQ